MTIPRISALALSLGLLMSAMPASAQHRHDEATAANPSPMMGMQMMAFMPARLLSQADRLGLSPAQTSRLEELGEAMGGREAMNHMATDARAMCAELSDETPDWDVYAEEMQEMASRMATMHVAMVRRAVEARSVLTPAQIEMVRQDAHAQRMPGAHGAAKPDAGGGAMSPMMPDGMGAGAMMDEAMMQMMHAMAGGCVGGGNDGP